MSNLFPPRIQALRDAMIQLLPRAPNNRDSLASLQAMPTGRLLLAYLTWRMRLIPAKPRFVSFWSGGVTPDQYQTMKLKLRPLLEKVAAGKDLTPHLSDLVHKKGIILPGARPLDKGKDIDRVLTREGLHHFHVGVSTLANPKGRSGSLVFAEVLEQEFRIVAISDHRAFDLNSPERLRFVRLCHAYMAKDIPPGQGFMANPVMSSGHSLIVSLFAGQCDKEMCRLDPLLDDPAFIDQLYRDQPLVRRGQPVERPATLCLEWYFEGLKFGILDRQSMVFFCLFPFFTR